MWYTEWANIFSVHIKWYNQNGLFVSIQLWFWKRLLFMYVRYSFMFASKNSAVLPPLHLILFAKDIPSMEIPWHFMTYLYVSTFHRKPITAALMTETSKDIIFPFNEGNCKKFSGHIANWSCFNIDQNLVKKGIQGKFLAPYSQNQKSTK